MKIGRYDCAAFVAGWFRLDGGAMFGSVPKPLWSREHEPDEKNRIQLAARVLVLRGEGRVILVDTGCGDKFSAKEAAIYAIDSAADSLEAGLRANGLAPGDITDVILTHLHFDHAGGATTFDTATQAVVPAFPNATYHVQQANLHTAQRPNLRERASYMTENFQPIIDAGKMVLVNGNTEILPGIRAIVCNGHTAGTQVVVVDGPDRGHGPTESLYFVADLMPTASHLRVPYTMGYDLHAEWVMDEKAPLLDRIAAENSIIVFEHDPKIAAARITKGERYHEIRAHVAL